MIGAKQLFLILCHEVPKVHGNLEMLGEKMTKIHVAIFALLMAVAPVSSYAEHGSSGSVLDRLLAATVVRSVEISPDGKQVAFRTHENDFHNNKDMAQLFVVPVDGSAPAKQLTFGEDTVSEFEWSADSSYLAFRRDGKLFFISISGGEPKELDLGVSGARGFQFAPDGGALFFTAGKQDQDKIEAREQRYGKYNVVREDGNFRHIWRAEITGPMTVGDPEQLTFGRDFTVTGYDVSPDSSQVAFSTWPTPHLVDLLKARIYTMAADGEEPKLIDESYGGKSTPIWRADGTALAYTNAVGFPDYSDIVINDLDGGTHTIKMPDHDPGLVSFNRDRILFRAGVRTEYGLFSINLGSDAISRETVPGVHAFGHSISNDGSVIASFDYSDGGLAEVAIVAGNDRSVLTNFADQLDGLQLPSKELVTWTNDMDQEIEGVLTKPVGFEEGKQYPLYVRTHGGPTGTDRPIIGSASRGIYSPEVLAAEGEGALVLQTNYRGSASYGNQFQRSNLKQLGIGPAKDIIAGVQMLVEAGMVDPDKVACLGWSQGGHISAMLATYSNICTAAIMGAGISDWRTYYYNTDITQFTTEYFGGTPYGNDRVYARTSPVTYINNAKTPVLIQHGENDARVPIANGYQLRQLLLDKGVSARMIVYDGMGHGPSKPRHRRAITEHALDWFREHLFGAGPADYVFPVQNRSAEED